MRMSGLCKVERSAFMDGRGPHGNGAHRVEGRLLCWFWVLFARHSFGHKFGGMETTKVSRFLLCARNTEAQVARDISGISDRSSKARTKETLSRDRIQFSARAGNQRRVPRAPNSVISREIHCFFSFLSNRPGNALMTALPNLPSSVYCDSHRYFASV